MNLLVCLLAIPYNLFVLTDLVLIKRLYLLAAFHVNFSICSALKLCMVGNHLLGIAHTSSHMIIMGLSLFHTAVMGQSLKVTLLVVNMVMMAELMAVMAKQSDNLDLIRNAVSLVSYIVHAATILTLPFTYAHPVYVLRMLASTCVMGVCNLLGFEGGAAIASQYYMYCFTRALYVM